MKNMFVHYSGTLAAFKEAKEEGVLLSVKYHDSIVFIKGGENGNGSAVYTHGNYYGDVKDMISALKGRVDGLKYFSKLSDGKSVAEVAEANGVISITGDDPAVTTRVDPTGIKVGLSEAFKTQVNETLPNDIKAVSDKLGEKGAEAASGTDATAFGRIKNLETIVAGLTGEEGGEVESVDAKITNAINKLDVDEISGDYIKAVKQVDGRIEATVGTFNFDEAGAADAAKTAVIGTSADASSADTIYAAKKYAEEKASAAETAAKTAAAADAETKANAALDSAKADAKAKIEALDAEVTSTDGSHVTVKVTEVDGVITAVNVTESDIASAAALAAVKSDVDYFLGSALNKENAEAVKDTLKEIQDYINSDVEGAAGMTASIKQAKDAADAAQGAADAAQGEVDALELVVAGVKATADAAATNANLEAEVTRATGAEAAINAAIKAISDDYLKKADKEELTNAINGKVAKSDYDVDKAALIKADSDNLAAAKEYAEGLVKDLDVTDAAVAGSYVSAVSQVDGKVSVSREKLPTYTLSTGSANGTVALNGVDAAVKGLGSAAFTESTAYATAAQGALAEAAAPQATTYTKTEVDAMWAWAEL